MRFVAFLGDRSSYGNHHLVPFLNMDAGRLVAVFLPTPQLWRRFAERGRKQNQSASETNSCAGVLTRLRRRAEQLYLKRRAKRVPNRNTLYRGNVQPAKIDVAAICSHAGIPIHYVDSANSAETLTLLEEYNPDVMLSAAFPEIFSRDFLTVPRLCSINFHPSRLPAYRGRHPHYWVVRNGEIATAVSAHILEATIDTGSVLASSEFRIGPDEYYEQVYSKINYTTPIVVSKLDARLRSRSIDGVPQDSDTASYFSEPTDANRCLRWSEMSATEAHNTIRAGGAFCYLRSHRLTVLSAQRPRTSSNSRAARPGRVSCRDGRCVVDAAEGVLTLDTIKFSGIQLPASVLFDTIGCLDGENLMLTSLSS